MLAKRYTMIQETREALILAEEIRGYIIKEVTHIIKEVTYKFGIEEG